MVAEIGDQHESDWAAMNHVPELLRVGSGETVRTWVRQVEVDAAGRPGRPHVGTEAAEARERRTTPGERDPESHLNLSTPAELDRPSH